MKDEEFLLLHELMDQIGKFSGYALLGCDGIGEAVVCPGDDVDPVGVAVDVDSHIVDHEEFVFLIDVVITGNVFAGV
jgi:hypothetical protein